MRHTPRGKSTKAKRRSAKRPQKNRRLRLQNLEQRQLLAGDIAAFQNVDFPEDVNADGEVSPADALMILNGLAGDDEIEIVGPNGENLGADGGNEGGDQVNRRRFRDVNGDGRLTPDDALRVLNRMSRDRADRDQADRGDRPNPQDNPPPQDTPDAPPVTESADEVRSIDGTGNNLADPTLGTAGTEFTRIVDADYIDGVSEPSGEDRASAREISNIIFDQDESILNDRGLSDIVWQWGQFIDHDITLTEEAAEDEHVAFNIEVPLGDEAFDPFATGSQEIDLTRSGVAEGTGIDSVAQQVNGITAFIDGSMVYGSDAETAESLRAFEGGRLATSENDLLPIGESGFFEAGDVRANEQHGLTAMHTLWVREHNRLADEIAASDSSLTDEEIYQQARETVIGEIQAITYNEYIPALLGRGAIDEYTGYDETVDPSISNLFATAAFRYGHSALSSELQRLDDDGNVIDEGNILLRDAFFNPADVLELGIDPVLKGLTSNVSQEIDTQVIDDVRDFLFGPPGAGGFDLAALNIQRGRDHGLPDYNSAREQLGLAPAESFADISSDPDVQARLEEAYGTVDDIDVWVGALAEDHVNGGSLGELASTVLADQFTALRDGDRFWYQNTFSGQELREIDSTRLSDVIERNTDLTSIQNNAFFVADAGNETDRPNRDRPDQNDPNQDRPTQDRPDQDGPRQDRPGNDQGPPEPVPPPTDPVVPPTQDEVPNLDAPIPDGPPPAGTPPVAALPVATADLGDQVADNGDDNDRPLPPPPGDVGLPQRPATPPEVVADEVGSDRLPPPGQETRGQDQDRRGRDRTDSIDAVFSLIGRN